jgi:GxxExxY protein
VTGKIIAAAIEVHRRLGPGLLESTYRTCLIRENGRSRFASAGGDAPFRSSYGDRKIDVAYRADLIVDDAVLLELKAVDKILPIHEAQTLTYLKHSRLRVGLLLNFNVVRRRAGRSPLRPLKTRAETQRALRALQRSQKK